MSSWVSSFSSVQHLGLIHLAISLTLFYFILFVLYYDYFYNTVGQHRKIWKQVIRVSLDLL